MPNLSHEVCKLLYGEPLPVYCPVAETNAVAYAEQDTYVCSRCEQVEGSNGSMFHGLPRDTDVDPIDLQDEAHGIFEY